MLVPHYYDQFCSSYFAGKLLPVREVARKARDRGVQVIVDGSDSNTARIVLSGREMGRLYHAKGVERLVRNSLWKGRPPERFYDALEWLYGWNVGNCLAAD